MSARLEALGRWSSAQGRNTPLSVWGRNAAATHSFMNLGLSANSIVYQLRRLRHPPEEDHRGSEVSNMAGGNDYPSLLGPAGRQVLLFSSAPLSERFSHDLPQAVGEAFQDGLLLASLVGHDTLATQSVPRAIHLRAGAVLFDCFSARALRHWHPRIQTGIYSHAIRHSRKSAVQTRVYCSQRSQ